MTIRIRPRLLAAVAKWAYGQDDREWLRIVRFGDDEIVATDGHRAVIVPQPTEGKTFGIHPKDIAAIAAAHAEAGGKYSDILIDLDDKHVSVSIANALGHVEIELRVRARDVKGYPPYRQIIPDKAETEIPPTFEFNASYLVAIDEVNREHPDFHPRGVKCLAWSALGKDGIPGPMSFKGAGGILFVVMPMRGERTE